MSKKLKAKVAILVVVVIASMVTMGLILTSMQTRLTLRSYRTEMEQEAQEFETLLNDAASESEQNTTTYDGIYKSKASSVAFLANNNTGYEATDAKMTEYKNLLGVDNVLIVRRDGTVLAKAADTKATFSHWRFNTLRQCLSSGKPSDPVEVELEDENWLMRYYAAKIDDNTMAVIEQNPAELRELAETTSSVESVLKNISIGQDGYVFAVSATDYLVTYHPNADLVGTDSLDDGLDVTALEDGNYDWMTLNGESLYCGVTRIDNTYYICAVPESDMVSSRNITVNVIVFAFLVVIAAVALYGIFVMQDEEKNGNEGTEYRPLGKKLRLNRTISKKASVLCIVGLVAVLVVSFYMQTLFALSSESLTNSERAQNTAETMQRANDRAADLEEQYAERYLSKGRVAAYAIQHNPELATRANLQRLADAVDVQYLYTFDSKGVMTATNSSYTNFTLSEDPEDQSYEFRQLLQGVDYVVQEAQPDEISGTMRQYIGVTIYKDDGEADGFVQLGIRPTRLEELLETVQIDHVLDGVKVGTDGFAFAVNKADGTIAYHPNSKLIGKSATEVGLEERQLKDGYSDYLTIDGTTYYAASVEQGDYYIYIAATEGELMGERIPLTLTCGGIALVCLLVIYALITIDPQGEAGAQVAEEGEDGSRTFDITMPSGRTAATESAASRWLNRSLKWDERNPGQKLSLVMKVFFGIAVLAVVVGVLFQDRFFPKGTVFSYILGGGWERGLNVFAITASIIAACVAITLASLAQELLRVIASALSARGETVCRLVGSFIKYATLIGMVYYCLILIGIDTGTLLASAGLLTLAVSLGAKDLVADILSGLFIIFEGEFRVGDIIQVGSNKGTVMDIGVRTTKINDGSGNILVLRNSNISNVINMTKELSVASVEVGIEYGESLERVETILAEELPNIAKRLPAIIEGPFYKGVSSLADNSVNIKITAKCKETDRGGLVSDLNREMKLLFDKHDISIPYPQIVVNEPVEFKKATVAEKEAADKFNAEQRVASVGVGGNEDEDFDPSNDSRH